jgi:hypothetical protein
MRRRQRLPQVQRERAGVAGAENHHAVRPKDLAKIRHVLVKGK